MLRKWKNQSTQIMLVLILITALTSCITSQKKITEEPKIQYDVRFPSPYDENGNPYVTLEKSGEYVRMPLWYWIKITEYAIYTEGNNIISYK